MADMIHGEEKSDDSVLKQLRLLGAHCDIDPDGNVRHIRFAVSTFTDASVFQLGCISGIDSIDVRDTLLTVDGVARLRVLLPKTVIHYQ